MAENENLVSIVIDASATEGAQASVKDANKELARFKRSVDKFKGSLSSFSDTSKDTSASISKFNTFLKGFSKTLESNMLKMQKDVFKNVEPVFTKNLEGMIDRVLNKVETKVSNKIDKTTGSRSRSEPKSSTNVDAAKPLIAKSQVTEGKQIADAIAEEFATIVRGVNGIAQPEPRTRTQGKKAETSDTYKSISDALAASQEKHTWASPVDQFAKTMNASIKKFSPSANYKVTNPQPTQKVSDLVGMSISDVLDKSLANAKLNPLEEIVSKINENRRKSFEKYDDLMYERSLKRVGAAASNAAKNNDFYGSSMRREMSSMLISLHILQTFGAHSQVFASGFNLIDNAVGHLLNVVLLPAMPLIANVAQTIHGIASAFQSLPPWVKSFISVIAYIKIVSSLVSAMPLKDFAQGIVAVYNAIKDPDSSRLVKFARAITEIFNAVTSNLFKAPVSKIGEWLGNTKIGKRITGKRADGGPVNNSGLYLVGERGPELFAPGVSGTIIPNHAFKRADGGDVTPTTEAFPSLPGMSDIGSSLLGGVAGGLGAGGLTYLLTGSPTAALAVGSAGAGVGATIGPQLPGMVGSALGTTLSIPGVQGMIGAVNVLTGTVSSILAPMAPLFGIVATTLGVMGGLKGGGGDAEATTRVGNTINKTVASTSNNLSGAIGGAGRGTNSMLSAILVRLNGCFRICAGSLAGAVPAPKDVTDTKESVVRSEERLKNIETKTEEIKKANEERLKRTEEISNKLTESEKNSTSLVEKITNKLNEVKSTITEKVSETIKTITETTSKTTETTIKGVLESVDTSKVKEPEVNVKGVAEPEIDMSRVRIPEFFMNAVIKTARIALDTGIEFPILAKIIKAELDKDAKIDPLPTDAVIKEAKPGPDIKIPELKTEGIIERVKVAPEILASGGTEVPAKAEVKEVKPISRDVISRMPIADLPARVVVDFAEFQKALDAQPLEARLAISRTIYGSDFYDAGNDHFVLRNDIGAKARIEELRFMEGIGLGRVGDHLEFSEDVKAHAVVTSLAKGEAQEVEMRLVGPTDEEVARANARLKNKKFTNPEVEVKVTTPTGEGTEGFKLPVTPEISTEFSWVKFKEMFARGMVGIGEVVGLVFITDLTEYAHRVNVNFIGDLIAAGFFTLALSAAQGIATQWVTTLFGAVAASIVGGAFTVVIIALTAVMSSYIAGEWVGDVVAGVKRGLGGVDWKDAFASNSILNGAAQAGDRVGQAFKTAFGSVFPWLPSGGSVYENASTVLSEIFKAWLGFSSGGVVGAGAAIIADLATQYLKKFFGVGSSGGTPTTPTPGDSLAKGIGDSSFVKGMTDLVSNIQSLARNGIPVDIQLDIDSITSTVSSIVNTITGGLSGVVNGVTNTVGGVVGGAVNTASNIVSGITGGNTSGEAPTASDPISGIINTVGGAIGGAVDFAGGLLGFAAGGNVTGGVPVIVGEKGPELFVPTGNGSIIPNDKSFLNNDARVTTNGIKDNQNTTINMYNNFTVTGKDEKTMFESIMKQLKPELQRMKV